MESNLKWPQEGDEDVVKVWLRCPMTKNCHALAALALHLRPQWSLIVAALGQKNYKFLH